MKSKKLIAPMLLALVATILMLVSVFLPYAREIGGSNPVTASMLELAEAAGGFNLALVALTFVFSLLTALFSLLKKPVAAIVFNILAFAFFLLQIADYSMRGIVPSDRVEYALAFYLFLLCSLVVHGGAVWMIVAKAKLKKQSAAHKSQA